jgi:hypothetical protein
LLTPCVSVGSPAHHRGLGKAKGGAEIATASIDQPRRYIEMLFTAPAEGKRIATCFFSTQPTNQPDGCPVDDRRRPASAKETRRWPPYSLMRQLSDRFSVYSSNRR